LPKEPSGLPNSPLRVAISGVKVANFAALNAEQAFDGVFRQSLYECGKKL
jgi:hypothetical protein